MDKAAAYDAIVEFWGKHKKGQLSTNDLLANIRGAIDAVDRPAKPAPVAPEAE